MTTDEDRTKGMGLLGAAFGLGFIVGPATGGILAKYDQSLPSWLAAGLSLLNLVAIVRFLPESRKSSKESSGSSSFVPQLSTLQEILTNPTVLIALGLRFGHSIVFTIFELWFGYFTSDMLGLTAQHSSYILTYYGIIYSLVQATAIRRLVQKYQETKMLGVVLHLLAASYAISYYCSNTLTFMLILLPLGILSGVSNTLISSLVSKTVDPSKVGGALGVSAALGSLSRIIGPTVTSYMSQSISLSSPPLVCASISFLLILLQFVLRSPLPRSSSSTDHESKKTR